MPHKYPQCDLKAPKNVHVYPSAKGVGLETGARVQIPQSASKADNKRIYCVCYRLYFYVFMALNCTLLPRITPTFTP